MTDILDEIMTDYDMSIHTNPDAVAWAKFFMERNPDCGIPEDVMIGWFANAMMAMHDYVTGTKTTVLPDGSAILVDKIRGANVDAIYISRGLSDD